MHRSTVLANFRWSPTIRPVLGQLLYLGPEITTVGPSFNTNRETMIPAVRRNNATPAESGPPALQRLEHAEYGFLRGAAPALPSVLSRNPTMPHIQDSCSILASIQDEASEWEVERVYSTLRRVADSGETSPRRFSFRGSARRAMPHPAALRFARLCQAAWPRTSGSR